MIPKVSVIMSVYNDSTYLSKSVESILEQTFSEFEFIICNDCSTDNSSEIINHYAMKDSRIKLLNNEKNLGLAASLNRCIELARGRYIARMDSDDISERNRLAIEFEYLENNKNVAVVGCKSTVIDECGWKYKEFLIQKGEIKLMDAIKKVRVIHPTVMIRTEALRSVGGYTVNELTQRAEDYDLWCKLLYSKYRICNIEDNLFCYREGRGAMKKRKYKYRVQEFKLKKYWMNKCKVPLYTYIYAIKPLIVGLIPKKIMIAYKEKY